jgi:hypothetical protein
MKRAMVLFCSGLASLVLSDSACTSGFAPTPSTEHIVVTFEPGGVPSNSDAARLPLSFTTPVSYTLKLQALRADGTQDTSFDGFVRLSSKPGSVVSVAGPGADGRNVQLASGAADNVQVQVLAAYGDTRIWGEDVGYVPADPNRVCGNGVPCPAWCKPGQPCLPACSNGIDDNDNGLIDYPAELGCFAANDDTEDGGSFSAGVSPTVYYYIPRIADVRGGPEGGTGTPFPSQAVNIDTGYRGENNFAFSVIVTRVSSAGFYVTDLEENAPGGTGFGSVYAYNFSAPANMRQCDRLRSFGGTTSDFYGFTEVNYPTWELEEWDPTTRLCGIQEPHTLAVGCSTATPSTTPDCYTIGDSLEELTVAASIVRVASAPATAKPNGTLDAPGTAIHIGAHFGAAHPCVPGDKRAECLTSPPPVPYAPTADATNCDYNNDGAVERTPATNPELLCANLCEADLECSEFSNYLSQNQFNLVVQGLDLSGNVTTTGAIQADGSADAQFDPVLSKGSPLRAFTGSLYYFSGGSQFTIQARCADDIITDLAASPIPSDTACVHARTTLDNSEGN